MTRSQGDAGDERLFHVGAALLVSAIILGLAASMGPIGMRAQAWFYIFNWIHSLLWIAAAAILMLALTSLGVTMVKDGPNGLSPSNLFWAERAGLALATSWVLGLPYAHLALPHYKAPLLLRLAGIEAFATGNALAAFAVCVLVLLFAKRMAD